MTEEINKGCEFQSGCIEYKDISYLKIMPICAIHELSIACHGKVNKCKYYKLYSNSKRLEQERDELKKACEKCKLFDIEKTNRDLLERIDKLEQENKELKEYSKRMENQRENYYEEYNTYRSALEEIREMAMGIMDDDIDEGSAYYDANQIINKIDEVLG